MTVGRMAVHRIAERQKVHTKICRFQTKKIRWCGTALSPDLTPLPP